ncbi:MAG: sterol desaturase family protein [Pseudomonadota bacterium]
MENEGIIRLSVFLGLFVLLACLEWVIPKRRVRAKKSNRWITNWAIVIIDTISLRLVAIVLPLLAVGAAINASNSGIGLFNHLDWPQWIEWLLVILVLDFLIWLQHVITHKVPILWRLHQVHHADTDMDVTTAIRFHPVEILFSMAIKIGAVYALGPAAWAVILFEILLNGTAMFNHSNISLPRWLDRALRWVIVTPDMHLVHHSDDRKDHDTNFGFALSIWDRLFRTYTDQPAKGTEGVTIGLQWQDEAPTRLGWSLALPFRKS